MISRRKPGVARLKIRKAAASDKAPILEISKKIWAGHDYLPEVWDEWLADQKGRFLVASVNGRTVGVARASLQTPDVAWLEGVRVHEEYRGYGIAGKLNMALVNWARRKHARVARLSTDGSNQASRKHLKKIGFPLQQTFQRLDTARPLRAKPAGVNSPRGGSMRLWNWISTRPEFVENRAMYSDGWTWYPLTLQSLRKQMKDRNVLVTIQRSQPTSLAILVDEDRVLTMGFVAGEASNSLKLVRMLGFLMWQRKREKARVLLPLRSLLVQIIMQSGYERTAKVLVYEKFLR